MILSGIQSLLASNAGIAALASNRIYPVLMPESLDLSTYGAVTYHVVGGSSDPTFTTSGMQKLRVQFDCFGSTFKQANLIREAIRLAINGYSGTLNDGTTLQWAELIQPIDHFENDARQYRCSSEYYLHFCFHDTSIPAAISGLVLTDSVTAQTVTLYVANAQLQVASGGSNPYANPVFLDSVTSSPYTLSVANGLYQVATGGSGGVAYIGFMDVIQQSLFQLSVASGQLEVTG